jgi:ASC-1-like (ASCH) protein
MQTHYLKTWPEYFEEVWSGKKTFEVRKDDRGFRVGDRLVLFEWNPEAESSTGRTVDVTITYILRGGQFGIENGHCVMAFEHLLIP